MHFIGDQLELVKQFVFVFVFLLFFWKKKPSFYLKIFNMFSGAEWEELLSTRRGMSLMRAKPVESLERGYYEDNGRYQTTIRKSIF